jgi:predicted metalloprotease with PDZ domain
MRAFFCLALFFYGCQTPLPQTPTSEPTGPFVGITARLREGVSSQPSTLDMELVLPLQWTGLELEAVNLKFHKEEFGKASGYESFILWRHAGGFKEWPDNFSIKDGMLSVQYRVVLKHHEAEPLLGVDGVPHPVQNGWFINGRAIIPHISVTLTTGEEKQIELPIRFRLRGREKDELLSSVDLASHTAAYEYQGETTKDLRDALYVIGHPTLYTFEASGVQIGIASSDFTRSDFGPLKDLIVRTLSGGTSLLGDAKRKKFLVIYDEAQKRDGSVVGDGISLLYKSVPTKEAHSEVGVMIVHELIHLWNQSEQDWLNEGFTRYAEILWSARLDNLSPLDAWKAMLPVVDSYSKLSGEASLRKAHGRLSYEGGAVLFLCLDARLRSEGLSLWNVWKDVRSVEPEAKFVRAEVFLAALKKASLGTETQLEEWLDTKALIDPTPCFQSLQMTYQAETKTLTAMPSGPAPIF